MASLLSSSSSLSDIYIEGDYRRLNAIKKTNPLLVRSGLGITIPTVYELPADNFTYGGRNEFDEFTVRDVISSWNIHQSQPLKHTGKDFIRANRSATIAGLSTAKQIKQFRASAELANVPLFKTKRKTKPPIIPIDKSVTYGKPSRPSTPIHNILNNQFQRDSIEQRRINKIEREFQLAAVKTLKSHPATHTRASLGHMKVDPVQPKEPFKLNKFTQIQPKVNTYRHQNTHNNVNDENNNIQQQTESAQNTNEETEIIPQQNNTH